MKERTLVLLCPLGGYFEIDRTAYFFHSMEQLQELAGRHRLAEVESMPAGGMPPRHCPYPAMEVPAIWMGYLMETFTVLSDHPYFFAGTDIDIDASQVPFKFHQRLFRGVDRYCGAESVPGFAWIGWREAAADHVVITTVLRDMMETIPRARIDPLLLKFTANELLRKVGPALSIPTDDLPRPPIELVGPMATILVIRLVYGDRFPVARGT